MSSTEMDGFIGCVLAAESVTDSTTILHGPFACRMFMSLASERYIKRKYETREGDFFFHFSRIPCTSTDKDDYIFGASKKVAMIMDILEQDETGFATIVQSPGAALIGDKLKDEVLAKGLDGKTLVIDSSFMSEKFSLGFDTTLTKMAEKLAKPSSKKRMTANIIGLPFTSRGYHRMLEELRKALSSIGIEVIAAIGAGCSLEEFSRSSEAEFNVCIHPEYCRMLSKHYEHVLGIPTIVSDMGAPIGYRSMRSFISNIAEHFGTDPSPVLDALSKDEESVKGAMESSVGQADYMNYKTFSIEGESSLVYPLADFLIRFLKMYPKSISLTESDPVFEEKIRKMLEKIGCEQALDEEFGSGYTNVLFGPGSFVKLLEKQGSCALGVDIAMPSRDQIDIAPKSVMGLEGLHRMLDDVLNARRRREFSLGRGSRPGPLPSRSAGRPRCRRASRAACPRTRPPRRTLHTPT